MINRGDQENLQQPLITSFFTSSRPNRKPLTTSPCNIQLQKEFARKYKKESEPELTFQWNGYLFVASNCFSEFRVLNLLPRPDSITKRWIEPGFVVANASTVDDMLAYISVDLKFRRQKIGVQLIQFINHCTAHKLKIYYASEDSSSFRLTEEGAKLINYCREKGLITPNQLVYEIGRMEP